ncbi:hypothetical protein VNO77_31176 [Canavalia gladiata]|uniref:Uncharacterized protein n=1 Tax=Canavalia gladiata TaxID=3824 RepID=A0AAN9Q3W1_CANGL
MSLIPPLSLEIADFGTSSLHLVQFLASLRDDYRGRIWIFHSGLSKRKKKTTHFAAKLPDSDSLKLKILGINSQIHNRITSSVAVEEDIFSPGISLN